MFGPSQDCDSMYVAAHFRSCADIVGLYGGLDVKFEISHGVKLKKSNNALIQRFSIAVTTTTLTLVLEQVICSNWIGVYFSFANSTLKFVVVVFKQA